MADVVAMRLLSQGPFLLMLAVVGLSFCGFALGCFCDRSGKRLLRAPYFVLTGMAWIAGAAAGFLVPLVWPALVAGVLWLVFAVQAVLSLGLGIVFGILAVRRARDGFGTPWAAPLALLPLLNLWLGLRRSRAPASPDQTHVPRFFSGDAGIQLGAGLWVVAIVLGAAAGLLSPPELGTAADEARTAALRTELVAARGVERTLQLLTAPIATPVTVDDGIVLTAVDVEGTRLRRSYTITFDAPMFDDGVLADIRATICGSPYDGPLIRAGATVEEVYRDAAGRLIGRADVSPSTCRG